MQDSEFRLYVFDLDFTLWDCGGTWCDCTSPPYMRSNAHVRDSRGLDIRLYPDVREILDILQSAGVSMALASRTDRPDWARELLSLFGIERFFDYFEIHPGSKISHFQSLQAASGIGYESMVFFDDEDRNIREVGSLGVHCVPVRRGLKKELVL